MSTRGKVLLVSPVPSHPINAGNRKRIVDISVMLRGLGYEVFFACYGKNISAGGKRQMYTFWGGRNHCFLLKKVEYSFWKRMRERIRTLTGIPLPYKTDEYFPDGILSELREVEHRYRFDVVFGEYTWSSKAFEVFPDNVKKVIDTHDILTHREQIFIKNGEKPTGVFMRKRQEQKGLRRADCIIAIQYREAATLKKMVPEKEIYTIGENMEVMPPKVVYNKNILFVASANKINEISLGWFLENVYPQIRENDDECRLLIAGTICKMVPRSAIYDRLGFVENIGEVYDRARVVVNPILGGTGLNIKTIEALSHSKPLVATKIGAKGIKHAPRVIRIADSADDFARSVVEICKKDKLAEQMSVNANRYIAEYHNQNWSELRKIMRNR